MLASQPRPRRRCWQAPARARITLRPNSLFSADRVISGGRAKVRAIKTEGDPQNIAPAKYAAEMERNVLNAAKRAHFPHPPKGATISDRSFLVRYVYY